MFKYFSVLPVVLFLTGCCTNLFGKEINQLHIGMDIEHVHDVIKQKPDEPRHKPSIDDPWLMPVTKIVGMEQRPEKSLIENIEVYSRSRFFDLFSLEQLHLYYKKNKLIYAQMYQTDE